MTKKGHRNENLQHGKPEKAYGGYLPSVPRSEEVDVTGPVQERPPVRLEETQGTPERG